MPPGPAFKDGRGRASPALPVWLELDRALSAEMPGRSLGLAPPVAGEARAVELRPETDPDEDLPARPPAHPGGFSMVFFGPD